MCDGAFAIGSAPRALSLLFVRSFAFRPGVFEGPQARCPAPTRLPETDALFFALNADWLISRGARGIRGESSLSLGIDGYRWMGYPKTVRSLLGEANGTPGFAPVRNWKACMASWRKRAGLLLFYLFCSNVLQHLLPMGTARAFACPRKKKDSRAAAECGNPAVRSRT